MKTVKVKICNDSGDTQKEMTPVAAVEEIINEHFKHGRWVYVGTDPVEFSAVNLKDDKLAADRAEIMKLLDKVENPQVVMTGDLQGGASTKRKAKVKTKAKAKSKACTKRNTNTAITSSTTGLTDPAHGFVAEPTFAVRDNGAFTSLSFGGGNVTLTRGPLLNVFNSHRTPQLAVSVQMIKGEEKVNVMVSNYKGSLGKLKRHLNFISDAIGDILGDLETTEAYMPGSTLS